MRARLQGEEGLPAITPDPRQDSALVAVLAAADALLIRPRGDGPRAAGERVEYLPL
jgi:molybdopterin molybdotransferase